LEEALEDASETKVDGVDVRVFTAEHLAAIALDTGRGKDKARLLQFLEARALDMMRFEAIVARNGLAQRWRQFKKQFLNDRT
jgi:hypothetical protein